MQSFRLLLALSLAGIACRRSPSLPSPDRSSAAIPKATAALPPPAPLNSLSHIYRSGDGITEPVPIEMPHPVLPEDRRRARLSSQPFLFEAVVDASGRVTDVRTLKTPGTDPPYPEIHAACIAAIRKWRYRPALLKGRPVSSYATITIGFKWQ